MIIPQLSTERLILRAFQQEDLDAYAQMCADVEVMRYLGGKPLPRDEAWRHMAMVVGHWYLKGYGLWAVEEIASGETIGRIGCWEPEGWPELEIAWTLRRNFWGKGYATEAAIASRNYAFEKLEASNIISLLAPENKASIPVAERIGEKFKKSIEMFGGERLIYGISREDWLKII